MSTQRHVILRQVVEVELPSERHAREVQEQVARFVYTHLQRILERRCDELGPADAVLRIDRMELDLGLLQADDLTAAVPPGLEWHIRTQFDDAIRRAESGQGGRQVTRTTSQLELLDHFVRTGTLPWWADPGRPGLVAAGLLFLADAAPDVLRSWLGGLDREAREFRRLALACDEETLTRLAQALAPANASVLLAGLSALVDAAASIGGSATGSDSTRWHTEFRADLLARLGAGGSDRDAVRRMCQQGVRRIAEASGHAPAQVLVALRRNASPALAPVLATMSDASADRAAEGQDTLPPAWDGLRARWPAWGGFLSALAPFVARVTGDARRELEEWLTGASQANAAEASVLAGMAWLRRAIEQKAVPEAIVRQWIDRAQQAPARHPDGLIRAVAAALPTPDGREQKEQARPTGQSFNDTDAVHVGNAGLVLLSAFLPRFFAELGLMEAKTFRDDAARDRAIGLLQFLADEERVPLEPQLPLNKVLCGAAIDEAFEFGPPVTDAEQSACAAFLAAVIAQAPILHDMSIAGFRGSFLLRTGQLSARDHAWLLRVERASYDVVLERFPWPTQWVRLPWMNDPMQVDWV